MGRRETGSAVQAASPPKGLEVLGAERPKLLVVNIVTGGL
jgi:hypothetical protein